METDRITKRPWKGQCATTGLTMEDFDERLANVAELPAWATRASVSICRSFAGMAKGFSGQGLSDPAYIANVIYNAHENRDGEEVW